MKKGSAFIIAILVAAFFVYPLGRGIFTHSFEGVYYGDNLRIEVVSEKNAEAISGEDNHYYEIFDDDHALIERGDYTVDGDELIFDDSTYGKIVFNRDDNTHHLVDDLGEDILLDYSAEPIGP